MCACGVIAATRARTLSPLLAGTFGDRHLEQRRDAASGCRGGSGLKVLARRHARMTRVHVRVDQAGQHVQAGRVDDFARRRPCRRVQQRGDAAVTDGDSRRGRPAAGNDRAVDDHRVERFLHLRPVE